jgi:hypothetical protein
MKYFELFCRIFPPLLCLFFVLGYVVTAKQAPRPSLRPDWKKIAEEVPYNWHDRAGWGADGVRFHTPKTKHLMLADIELMFGKPLEKFTLVKRENEETSDRPEVLTFHVYPKFMLMESNFAAQPHSVAFIIVVE